MIGKISNQLKDLNLHPTEEDSCGLAAKRTTHSKTSPNPRPKSPKKSPSKMAAKRANKPYDVPSACGPGGLVSMLKNLRQLRDIDSEIDASNDSASNMDDTYITCRGIGDESKEHEKILMDTNGKTGHKR